ncbi:MAG: putative rane protein, partial [Thermoanaerobaculia bacterium]|nr:putative rane protein [Thermoanaerobaculia bacterium]
ATATTSTDTTAAAVSTTTGSTSTSTVPPADLEFATTASMANLYEIEAAKLALTKAAGAAYKEFAQTMVTQHTEIGDSYKPIAEKQGLPMPTTLSGDPKTQYDQLSAAAPGAAFDALYKQQMIATHTAAKGLFETESTSGQDPDLKAFAAKWLSTVEHHLEMAQALPNTP